MAPPAQGLPDSNLCAALGEAGSPEFHPDFEVFESHDIDLSLTIPDKATVLNEDGLNPHRKSWRQRHLTGWRFGASLSCSMAILVFLINASVMIWASAKHTLVDGTGTLYKGNCAKAKSLNTWVQLAINILSTILLTASNYCMQCLSAPTRQELDVAHAKRKHLEIGVPSFKNLRNINRRRVILWVVLGLSALPLHFVHVSDSISWERRTDSDCRYNSVLYLTIQANTYTIMVGPENFIENGANNSAYYQYGLWTASVAASAKHFRARIQAGELRNISSDECFKAYNHQYVSAWRDVLLIENSTVLCGYVSYLFDETVHACNEPNANYTLQMGNVSSLIQSDLDSGSYSYPGSNPPRNDSIIYSPECGTGNGSFTKQPHTVPCASLPTAYPSNKWQCPEANSSYCPSRTDHKTTWISLDGVSKIKNCWAEPVKEECTLKFNLYIGVVVLLSNLLKAVCMCYTLISVKASTLITIGDAIQSFMENGDEYSKGTCTFSDERIDEYWQLSKGSRTDILSKSTSRQTFEDSPPVRWQPCSVRWWQSCPLLGFRCYLLWLGAFVGAYLYLVRRAKIFSFSLDSAPGTDYLPMSHSLLATVLMANSPQVLISYIFLSFNYFLTCMLSGKEIMSYGLNRAPLRVTNPAGAQRSTYYLQLPYQYSLPLAALSALLSWLASQALHVVQIAVDDRDNLSPSSPKIILTCSYSNGAIISSMIVGTIIALTAFLLSLRKYPDGMPLAGTNSAAISAICHRLPEDVNAAVLPVKWGVVSIRDGVGHAAFSSGVVAPLIPGYIYK